MKIRFTPETILYLFGSVITLLVLAHISGLIIFYYFQHTGSFYLLEYVNMASENNFPTFFSSLQLLCCAAVLALIALMHQKKRKKGVWHWAGLSAIFLFMSLDESLMIHEFISIKLLQKMGIQGDNLYVWIVPYSLLVLLVGLSYLRFLLRLPPFVKTRFILAAFLFVAAALGLELVESYYFTITGVQDFNYAMLVTLEETLEMSSILLFLYSLLCYIAHELQGLDLRLRAAPTPAPEQAPVLSEKLHLPNAVAPPPLPSAQQPTS